MKLDPNYFKAGESWFAEKFVLKQIEANRYLLGFIVSSLIALTLTIALIIMLPLKTIEPLIIHQNHTTGETWVEKPKNPYIPQNEAQIKSDLVRYIIFRESYSGYDINQRFDSVIARSNSKERAIYNDFQSNSNPNSPINTLRKEGTRTVKVEDLIFLDKEGASLEDRELKVTARNLAKIDFKTTTTSKKGDTKVENWVATISWHYRGTPTDQVAAWENWNGFEVTYYRIDQRTI